jgi:hypothetical protein
MEGRIRLDRLGLFPAARFLRAIGLAAGGWSGLHGDVFNLKTAGRESIGVS